VLFGSGRLYGALPVFKIECMTQSSSLVQFCEHIVCLLSLL